MIQKRKKKPSSCKPKPKTLSSHQAMASKFTFFTWLFQNIIQRLFQEHLYEQYFFFLMMVFHQVKVKQGSKFPKIGKDSEETSTQYRKQNSKKS